MSEWKETSIGNLCTIKHGFAYKGEYITNEECSNVLVTPGNFTLSGGFKMMDKPKYYKGPVEKEYILKEGDLIVTMTDLSKGIDTLGYSALVPKINGITFHHNQRIGLIENISEEVDKGFLYWTMRTRPYQRFVANSSSGTTVHHTSPNNISRYSFLLPPLAEQKNIASILFSLDSKIAVNRRICENLEAQAQALFKHWFIDFAPFKNGQFVESELGMIPEGLIYKRIEDMPHTLETGKRPAGGVKGIDSGVPSIGAENIKGLGCYDFSKTKFVTKEFAASMKRGKINGYELLVYKDGGKPGYFIPNFAIFGEGYPYDEMCLNEHVFKLDFGNKGYSLFAYFFFKTKQIMSYLNAQGAKAAIPGINSKDIDAILMPSLENESVKNYCNNVEGIITQILLLSKESARLATLRDTLLPKLMSGQIKV